MFDIVHYTICHLYPDSVNSVHTLAIEEIPSSFSLKKILSLDSTITVINLKIARQAEKSEENQTNFHYKI